MRPTRATARPTITIISVPTTLTSHTLGNHGASLLLQPAEIRMCEMFTFLQLIPYGTGQLDSKLHSYWKILISAHWPSLDPWEMHTWISQSTIFNPITTPWILLTITWLCSITHCWQPRSGRKLRRADATSILALLSKCMEWRIHPVLGTMCFFLQDWGGIQHRWSTNERGLRFQ